MLKYMLDTNICIFTIKHKSEQVREAFRRHQGRLCISSITLMELIYGTEKSAIPEKNLNRVESFVARLQVLDYDDAAAIHSGQLHVELVRKGKQIGPYDQLIAGHARALGLTLITNNLREFERGPGLRVEDWV